MNETLNSIEIGNYRISRADERNLQVDEFKTVKAKPGRYVKVARETNKWVNRGFYPDVKSAANAILGFQTSDGIDQSKDLKSLITFVSESKTAIEKAVQGAGLTLESMNRHVNL